MEAGNRLKLKEIAASSRQCALDAADNCQPPQAQGNRSVVEEDYVQEQWRKLRRLKLKEIAASSRRLA